MKEHKPEVLELKSAYPATPKKLFEPLIVCFACNYCTYAGADYAGTARIQYPPNVIVIRHMCSGRYDPLEFLEALRLGADFVWHAGCHPGDCHFLTGNYKASRRFALLKKLCEQLGFNPERLILEWVSAAEGDRFASIVRKLLQKYEEIGPSPMKNFKEEL
ncbi:MAG: hypothetical protein DRJ31_04630 [Candidatus Methanomethylicota archaeon]|uniref:F420-non-reducing hydrogenase iron-sulfur subunit D domain-containing protein n=1 Tax=Thermoproteota archaeon TaxID=2056631 RepID=A0A497ES28_9CREN|nr:MAG: hypothetical protein DRJ31_04630 [Candidatus Verstraetearchaeota archaeon]RLE53460.1 MAG: hypothetical protein DRJ33_00965 [Candidatus Verstraetearchaeota archaeon]